MLNGFPFMYLIYYKTYSLSAKAIKKHRWLPQIEYIVSLSGLGGGMVGKISMKKWSRTEDNTETRAGRFQWIRYDNKKLGSL